MINAIARIAYNTKEWKHASGPEGKSNSFKSYEKQKGFAHEEFLNYSKKLGTPPRGLWYGFIQGVHKSTAFEEKDHVNLVLLTKNSQNKKLYLVGFLTDVQKINPAILVAFPDRENIPSEAEKLTLNIQFKNKKFLPKPIEVPSHLAEHFSRMRYQIRFRQPDGIHQPTTQEEDNKALLDFANEVFEKYFLQDPSLSTKNAQIPHSNPVSLGKAKEFSSSQEEALELLPSERQVPEGRRILVEVSRIERNPHLRKRVLEEKGVICHACGMSFEKIYGEIGKQFIEVHHIYPLSSTDEEQPNTTKDLVPLCSNCHQMIHRLLSKGIRPEKSLKELRRIIKSTVKAKS